jgi:hypothetical protein
MWRKKGRRKRERTKEAERRTVKDGWKMKEGRR